MQRFRGGLVFKAHRLLYHSTLALRVIQNKGYLVVRDVGAREGRMHHVNQVPHHRHLEPCHERDEREFSD